ncbi:MAG: iron-sulfur cluster assembly scaffold protein [Actinobacteria bacterium]|nr:iron-sulfur cluster assembly scaffold protein [Actinomycetota bacterium]
MAGNEVLDDAMTINRDHILIALDGLPAENEHRALPAATTLQMVIDNYRGKYGK